MSSDARTDDLSADDLVVANTCSNTGADRHVGTDAAAKLHADADPDDGGVQLGFDP